MRTQCRNSTRVIRLRKLRSRTCWRTKDASSMTNSMTHRSYLRTLTLYSSSISTVRATAAVVSPWAVLRWTLLTIKFVRVSTRGVKIRTPLQFPRTLTFQAPNSSNNLRLYPPSNSSSSKRQQSRRRSLRRLTSRRLELRQQVVVPRIRSPGRHSCRPFMRVAPSLATRLLIIIDWLMETPNINKWVAKSKERGPRKYKA